MQINANNRSSNYGNDDVAGVKAASMQKRFVRYVVCKKHIASFFKYDVQGIKSSWKLGTGVGKAAAVAKSVGLAVKGLVSLAAGFLAGAAAFTIWPGLLVVGGTAMTGLACSSGAVVAAGAIIAGGPITIGPSVALGVFKGIELLQKGVVAISNKIHSSSDPERAQFA